MTHQAFKDIDSKLDIRRFYNIVKNICFIEAVYLIERFRFPNFAILT
jgi:hypothetical protein